MNNLKHFSDADLANELARRTATREREDSPIPWCEECLNFIPWPTIHNVPADYNPCRHDKKMAFHMPDGPTDDFGFYLRGCKDRNRSSVATDTIGDPF